MRGECPGTRGGRGGSADGRRRVGGRGIRRRRIGRVYRETLLKYPESAGIRRIKIVLTDINPHNLEMVKKIISRIVKVNHLATRITATTDLREALKDARYIMNVVRIGDLEAFADDIRTR